MLKLHPVLRHIRFLKPQFRRKVALLTLAKTIVGMLDAFALLVFGLAASLLTAGFGIKNPVVLNALAAFNLNPSEELASRFRLSILLGIVVVGMFLLKSILQIAISTLIFKVLSEAELDFIEMHLKNNISKQINFDSKEALDIEIHKLMSGSSALFSRTVAQYYSLFADLASVFVICCLLLVFQPMVAIGTAFYFAIVGLLFSSLVSERAKKFGQDLAIYGIRSDRTLRDYLENYKVIELAGAQKSFRDKFLVFRREQINAQSKSILLSSFPRHFIESSMVLGFFLLAIALFLTLDWSLAASTLLLFLGAASRIAPVFVSILGSITTIQGAKKDVDVLFSITEGQRFQS